MIGVASAVWGVEGSQATVVGVLRCLRAVGAVMLSTAYERSPHSLNVAEKVSSPPNHRPFRLGVLQVGVLRVCVCVRGVRRAPDSTSIAVTASVHATSPVQVLITRV